MLNPAHFGWRDCVRVASKQSIISSSHHISVDLKIPVESAVNCRKLERGCMDVQPKDLFSKSSPIFLLFMMAQKSMQTIYRRQIISVYVLATVLLYADYNLLAPNLSQVAEEFGMSDKERDLKLGGQIALSFFMFGVPSSVIVGWLADSLQRRAPLFATAVLLGEVGCFATYFVRSFTGLLITRTITGIGIGGSIPVVYSVLGDLYKSEGRSAISGVIATASGLGLGIGQALAGYLGSSYGWRLPFLLVSIPAFVVGVMAFFLPEPDRGEKEEAVIEINQRCDALKKRDIAERESIACHSESESGSKEKEEVKRSVVEMDLDDFSSLHSNLSLVENLSKGNHDTEVPYLVEKANLRTTCEMLQTPTIILILLQGAPNVIPFGITSVFLNDYLVQDKGLTTKEATSVLLTFGAGNAIGVIFGSTLSHFAYKRDARLPAILMGSSIMLTSIPMLFVINVEYSGEREGIVFILTMVFLAGLLSIFPVPIERAILTNVALPETRGRANSYLNIIDDLGKGLGPFLLSFMILSLGRKIAFNLSLIGWLVGGTICLGMFFTVSKDEKMVQDKIRNKLGVRDHENDIHAT